MNIFKQLENAMESVTVKLKISELNEEIADLKVKKKWLTAVKDYIKNGTYATKTSFIERVNYTLRYGRKAAATKFNTSADSIKVSMKLANDLVCAKLGDDIITLILNGNYIEVDYRLSQALGLLSLKNYIHASTLSLMPSPTSSEKYDLGSCTNELKFLKGCTIVKLQEAIGKQDAEKLAYILYLFDNGDAMVKKLLFQYISGATPTLEVIEKYSEEVGV